jgi:hypothetical protein
VCELDATRTWNQIAGAVVTVGVRAHLAQRTVATRDPKGRVQEGARDRAMAGEPSPRCGRRIRHLDRTALADVHAFVAELAELAALGAVVW